jgi:DNA-binding transcriptional ArsR family regulator
MSKLISGQALRERLLERVNRAPSSSPDAWVQAIAAPGNRELLSLIAHRNPQSISELSEFAGRAQPNVSRSLTALIQAGLVEVRSEGRASIPTLTDLGRDKARDLGLAAPAATQPVAASTSQPSALDAPRLSVSFAPGAPGHDDTMPGDLVLTVAFQGSDQPVVAKQTGDLNAIVIRILDHWWRMLYRRDAPYKIGEFVPAASALTQQISLAARSTGNHIEQIVRSTETPSMREQPKRYVPLETFRDRLLDDVVRPAVAHMRSGKRYDRPIQSKLARLEDSLSQEQESIFARTVGSLGDSPYDLTDEYAKKVRNLIVEIPDEGSRLDFCSAVLTKGIDEAERWTRSEISKRGQRNAMPELQAFSVRLHETPVESSMRPWRRGTTMAARLREYLNLAPETSIADFSKLAAMFGATAFQPSPHAPGSLRAFQSRTNDTPTIVIEHESPANTKFILARAIGDFLVFRSGTSCVANLYTERQAVGRAFAAEFIAPAEGVVRMIEDEDQSVERVADHYGAPEDVIHHQYDNNHRRLIEA